MTIQRLGWVDKHFYQLLCIHRLRWCHNSVYTIDIRALSGNEHFDTLRTLIKSTTTTTTQYCVNISSVQQGVVVSEGCNYLTSVSRGCLWCVRHLVYIYYMKVTWATALPFSLTLVFGACITKLLSYNRQNWLERDQPQHRRHYTFFSQETSNIHENPIRYTGCTVKSKSRWALKYELIPVAEVEGAV